MRFKGKWKTRRYLRSIILLMTTSVLALLVVFSTAIYLNVEKAVMQNEERVNRKLLLQVKYNIDQMQEMIDTLCLSVYLNADAMSLMYGSSSEYEDLTIKINRLRTMYLDMNPYVHSVAILNKNNKRYSTSNNGLLFDDTALNSFIREQKGQLPKIRPVMREIEETTPGYTVPVKRRVFTYFLYDSLDRDNMPEGAVVVNIKSEWLLESIMALNATDGQMDDRLFLVDSNTQLIPAGKDESDIQESVLAEYLAKGAGNTLGESETGAFRMKAKNREYLVSYVLSKKSGWVILKTQPTLEVYSYINKLKTSILFISLLFLSLTVLVSVTVSSRIYRPIRNLLEEMTERSPRGMEEAAPVDEFSYIRSVLIHSSDLVSSYMAERSTNRFIMKTYFLRKLLVDSMAIGQEEFVKAKEEYGISLQPDQPIRTAILRIDCVGRGANVLSPSDMELARTIMMKFIMEVFTGKCPFEMAEINEDVILLIGCDGLQTDQLENMLREAQRQVADHCSETFSVTVSDPAAVLGEISRQYNLALGNSMYGYVFGTQCLIRPQDVSVNNACRFRSFSTTLERKLGEEIKGGNLESTEEVLAKILEEIKGLSYKNMVLSVMHLVNVISDAVEEINHTRLETVFTDYNAFQNILEASTITDLHEECMTIFKQIMNRPTDLEREKKSILADAVKEIIQANYGDSSLCLQQIAGVIRMSSVYVGKVFKMHTGLSVAEYINEIRLNKAAEMLQETTAGIGEICTRIGMENESYFYKLFKKKYGSTPKEFMLKRVIHSKRNTISPGVL